MKLILSHTSALDFMRAARWRRDQLPPARIRSLDDCARSRKDVESILLPAFDQTQTSLEVLVGRTDDAQKSAEHICRVLKAKPLPGMFCKIDENAYTVSPEMLFVQMATRLSFIELLRLGYEMCGTYAPSPHTGRFDERPPLTTKANILQFCKRASEVRGTTTAAHALRWVADNSNSPAETALVLYLCLPVRLGGYGFGFPDMNPVTELGKRASKMADYATMRCDLHWVENHVVVEYDSDQEHLSSQSASRDAWRRNVLGFEDVRVITVRKPMLQSAQAFDDVARQLARALGRRIRPRDLEFTSARADLRRELFPWIAAGSERFV